MCCTYDKEADMNPLEAIRAAVKALSDKDPHVHVNVSIKRPKISILNDPAEIVGIYPNVFRLREHHDGCEKLHTVKYSDILTGQIEILELAAKTE